tara:strand:- start:52 stop:219 length:168 start_codon:yes stop_codon:yes gene_type:complete
MLKWFTRLKRKRKYPPTEMPIFLDTEKGEAARRRKHNAKLMYRVMLRGALQESRR